MWFKRKQPLNLLILGGQGSGKGSQCEFICKRYNIPSIAMGELFREAARQGTKVGLEAKSFMDKGILVPDDVTIRLLQERLKQRDTKNGFILDGFPRTMVQSDKLDEVVKITAVINLQAPDDILIDRCLNRVTCGKCKKIYSLHKLKDTKICVECGGELIARSDDVKEAILKRLEVFHKETEPLLKKYAPITNKNGQSIVLNIDATKTVPEVDEEITRKLTEFLK